jgi:hypothetical protein
VSTTPPSTTAPPSTTERHRATASASRRRLAVAALVAAAVGVAAGLVWLWLAHPARWEARDGRLVLTEAAARGQFSVVVVFVLIGVIVSVVGGWLVVRLVPELGWLAVPAVLVLTTLAALVAWRVGVALGPPDPSSVSGVADGDRVPSRLVIDSVAPFLVWPIFGLAGVIGGTWSDGRQVSERSEPRPPR